MAELWKTQFQSNLGSLPRQAKGWLENDSLSCGGGWQASSAVSRPVGSRLAPSPTGVSPFPRHLIHILTNEPYVVRRYLPHFLHEKLNDSGHKLFSAVKMVVPHIDVSVSLTNARRAGKLRDSYGSRVHGEIPQGISPRKLTVPPWKASDFPALQTLITITETVSLETESSIKGSFTVRSTRIFLIEKALQKARPPMIDQLSSLRSSCLISVFDFV